jgi:DNA mismatch repair protein MutL
MSVIRILPETLSNKIAAGEVVERPASIVKELVENAIDAQSTRISVQVDRGGMSLIRVSDNGRGMDRDDALLCLERYATSKLGNDQDLFSISTLGFRGEAVPSIASVSNFSLVTRDAESEAATEIIVSGGKIKHVRDVGAPVGTMVEVRQLFFNVPARRKFLKSAATEMGHIADMMTGFALCRPDIHFRLSHDDKTVKNWPAAGRPLDRITETLGRDTRNNLNEIAASAGGIEISGWISTPHITRRSSQRIYLFVNGRMIRDRGLQYALFEGYRGRLVKGTFPVAVIFVRVPFDRIDVNVHPTKNEVRFVDQKHVYTALRSAVENVWKKTEPSLPWERGADRPPPFTAYPPPRQETMPFVTAESGLNYNGVKPYPGDMVPPTTRPSAPEPVPGTPSPAVEVEKDEVQISLAETRPTLEPDRDQVPRPSFRFSDLAIVGQFHHTYIVCESAQEIFLIDQHAAHERVVFEKLKKRARARKPVSQGLLVPETVELTFRESAALESVLPELEQAGLLLERFGQNTYVIKAVPDLITDTDAVRLVQELAGKLADIGLGPEIGARQDEALSVMACHGAVRANQRLNENEMRAILNRLDVCDNPWHCPHGRPTIIHWSLREIERQFKRIV